MKVIRIFRKSNSKFHSFERVFEQVRIPSKYSIAIEDIYLPFGKANIISILGNLLFVLKFRNKSVHITGGVHYLMLVLKPEKTILTIHDSVYLKSTSGIKGWLLKKLFLDLPTKRAKFITTISEKSKKELVENANINLEKIIVIPNPVDQHIYYKKRGFNTDCPNLLFIGSTQFKNLERALKALKQIPCRLVLVGHYNSAQLTHIKDSGLQVAIKSGLSDREIADEYAASDIVYFPSLYEGFGLPIIEGQRAGRVVLTSDLSPMKEVAGNGACLVNPENVASISAGVRKIIHDANYRMHLLSAGFENVKQYDPENISQQYAEMYIKLQK